MTDTNNLPIEEVTPKTTGPISGPQTYGAAHSTLFVRDIDAYTGHIIGTVLTILETVLEPGAQQVAAKKLIKQNAWQSRDEVWRWMSRQMASEKTGHSETFPYKGAMK